MEFTPFPKVPRLSREVVITEKIDGTNASVWIEEVIPERTGPNTAEVSFSLTEPDYEIVWGDDDRWFKVRAASRKRFITPDDDNFGFAAWVRNNAKELVKLGPGTHFGEWWGRGIQRGYGLDERRFSLFNVGRWVEYRPEWADVEPGGEVVMPDGMPMDAAPACCHVVPVLFRGPFDGASVIQGMDFAVAQTTVERVMVRLQHYGSTAAPSYMNPEGIMIYHTAANQMFKKTFEGDERGKEAA